MHQLALNAELQAAALEPDVEVCRVGWIFLLLSSPQEGTGLAQALSMTTDRGPCAG